MADIPVNHRVLSWARAEIHMSVETAATKIGIESIHLDSLESGSVMPTLTVLRKMAAVYRLPLATLAAPQAPARSKLPKDFRTFDGGRGGISPKTALAIRDARRSRDALEDVFAELDEIPPKFLRAVQDATNAPQLAESERARFGLSIDRQLGWRTTPQALATWRGIVEATGIFVFVFDMPLDDCRGFSLKEEGPPVIVISKEEESEGARIFTLFHEYCHILIGQPGLSDLNRSNSVEKFCNEFASHFLMPEPALRAVLDIPRDGTKVDWEPWQIRAAAKRLHVSQQALALRLETAGYAPIGFFDAFKAKQPKRAKKKSKQKGGVPPPVIRLLELGPMFAKTVLRALDQGVVSDLNAGRVLDLAPKHFEGLRDRLEGHGPVRRAVS
jgi:Zn-dependent peptidase ImmA (M78 family)/DNA-binding XRE family transcriptional regulator